MTSQLRALTIADHIALSLDFYPTYIINVLKCVC